MPITNPVQLFQTVVDRLNAEDWTGAAGLCDPVSLVSFRRTMLQQFAPIRPRNTMTVEEYLKLTPDMPRAVAEYNVKQQQKSIDPEIQLHRQFPTVDSVAALRALEPTDFFAEWFYGQSPQRQLRDQAKDGAIGEKAANAIFSQPMRHFAYDVLGFLPNGDRIAHVLYQLQMAPPTEARADEWLANVPEDEREYIRDTSMRGHPQMFLCRKQPDGGWLGVAEFGFVGTGIYASFESKGDDRAEDFEEEVIELSP